MGCAPSQHGRGTSARVAGRLGDT